jgi:hypothetical protein
MGLLEDLADPTKKPRLNKIKRASQQINVVPSKEVIANFLVNLEDNNRKFKILGKAANFYHLGDTGAPANDESNYMKENVLYNATDEEKRKAHEEWIKNCYTGDYIVDGNSVSRTEADQAKKEGKSVKFVPTKVCEFLPMSDMTLERCKKGDKSNMCYTFDVEGSLQFDDEDDRIDGKVYVYGNKDIEEEEEEIVGGSRDSFPRRVTKLENLSGQEQIDFVKKQLCITGKESTIELQKILDDAILSYPKKTRILESVINTLIRVRKEAEAEGQLLLIYGRWLREEGDLNKKCYDEIMSLFPPLQEIANSGSTLPSSKSIYKNIYDRYICGDKTLFLVFNEYASYWEHITENPDKFEEWNPWSYFENEHAMWTLDGNDTDYKKYVDTYGNFEYPASFSMKDMLYKIAIGAKEAYGKDTKLYEKLKLTSEVYQNMAKTWYFQTTRNDPILVLTSILSTEEYLFSYTVPGDKNYTIPTGFSPTKVLSFLTYLCGYPRKGHGKRELPFKLDLLDTRMFRAYAYISTQDEIPTCVSEEGGVKVGTAKVSEILGTYQYGDKTGFKALGKSVLFDEFLLIPNSPHFTPLDTVVYDSNSSPENRKEEELFKPMVVITNQGKINVQSQVINPAKQRAIEQMREAFEKHPTKDVGRIPLGMKTKMIDIIEQETGQSTGIEKEKKKNEPKPSKKDDPKPSNEPNPGNDPKPDNDPKPGNDPEPEREVTQADIDLVEDLNIIDLYFLTKEETKKFIQQLPTRDAATSKPYKVPTVGNTGRILQELTPGGKTFMADLFNTNEKDLQNFEPSALQLAKLTTDAERKVSPQQANVAFDHLMKYCIYSSDREQEVKDNIIDKFIKDDNYAKMLEYIRNQLLACPGIHDI